MKEVHIGVICIFRRDRSHSSWLGDEGKEIFPERVVIWHLRQTLINEKDLPKVEIEEKIYQRKESYEYKHNYKEGNQGGFFRK